MSLKRTKYLRDFHRQLDQLFTLEELQILSSYLNLDWENLEGKTKLLKSDSLIKHLSHRGRLIELRELAQEYRPNTEWPELPTSQQQKEDAKANITAAERKNLFDNLLTKIGPLANGVMQIKVLIDANKGYLDTQQMGVLIRLLADTGLASYINFEGISLSGEELSNVNLSNATLENLDLVGSKLRRTNLSGANLYGANLSQADLYQADLRRAMLGKANLSEANLSGADLYKTSLRKAVLKKAVLSKAKLYRADLSKADLSGSVLNGAELNGADLGQAKLHEADLSGADLKDVHLNEAELHQAKYTAQTQFPINFDPAAAGAVLINESNKSENQIPDS